MKIILSFLFSLFLVVQVQAQTMGLVRGGNPAASFEVNEGGGGNFTLTGSLDACSTSPSD